MIKVESDFDPLAVSDKGAVGLMQLMPETARRLGVRNTLDPVDNIAGGVKYLRSLLNEFEGRLPLALAAYNAGRDTVLEHKGIPPFPETQNYVDKVLKYYVYYGTDGRR
jgi:soluble lytic murein transglycosylase